MRKQINAINEAIKDPDFTKWKKKNVTLRGMKSQGEENQVYGSFGKGLYTAFLSNKAMAKQYGTVHFVVNAIPSKPKTVSSLNEAEIFLQKLITDYGKKYKPKKDGADTFYYYDRKFFSENTTIEQEIMKLGYDGFVIKGREMVHYKPQNVQYFLKEEDLYNYYLSNK